MSYAKGDAVVVRGTGLGKVKRVGSDGSLDVVISDDAADLLELAADVVEKRVRPVLDRAGAERLLQVLALKLGKPDRRAWGEQYADLQKVLRDGDAAPMAARLQRLYRTPKPLPATVERVINKYEDALLPELAQVLGKSVATLRAELHKDQPAFGFSAPERPDNPPAALPKELPSGWKCLGTFRIFSGKLVVGEATERDLEATFPGRSFHTNLNIEVRNGDWFALVQEGAWIGVFVHVDAMKGFDKQLSKSRELGKVRIEGGTLCVLDKEVRDDRSFQRSQTLAVNEPVQGRGFIVATGGDGVLPVHGVSEGKEVVIVATPHD
jgi:RNA polymerase-interacting CarD/CdnL/TRCF family regulator